MSVAARCLRHLLHPRRFTDARRVAARWEFRTTSSTSSGSSASTSVSNFVDEYAPGRTPIPCVQCNGDLKFATLAGARGGTRRSRRSRPGTTRASIRPGPRATGSSAAWTNEGSVVLPVHADSGAARARAVSGRRAATSPRSARCPPARLAVADKPDSHEIRFVPDGDHAGFVDGARRGHGGEIRDSAGPVARAARGRPPVHRRSAQGPRPLDRHSALRRSASTPTQAPSPWARATMLERAALTASARELDLSGARATARACSRIRHRHRETPPRSRRSTTPAPRCAFDDPQTAVTPGQAVVFTTGRWSSGRVDRLTVRLYGSRSAVRTWQSQCHPLCSNPHSNVALRCASPRCCGRSVPGTARRRSPPYSLTPQR